MKTVRLSPEGPPPEDLPEDSGLTFNPERTRVLDDGQPAAQETVATTLRPEDEVVFSVGWPGWPAPGEAAPGPAPAPTSSSSYQLLRVIGRGGFGEVWEAVQGSLHRTIAVKRLRRDRRRASVSRGPSVEDVAFQQEALTAAHLDHPNIVPVHDLGVDGEGRPLLAMKLVRGRAWNEVISEDFGTLPQPEYLKKHLTILLGMAQAVAFAHSKGIVHRDLKPPQVMVGDFGEVFLMDWGLAVHVGDLPQAQEVPAPPPDKGRPPGRDPSTISNPAGTASFMAPEQTARTPENIGPWTDIYLLGGTLYYVLTRTPPHNHQRSWEAFLSARLGQVEAPEVRRPDRDIPPELSALVMKALSFDVAARHASVLDFIRELSDYLNGSGKVRESIELTERVARELETTAPSYRTLSEWAFTLARAQGLWPENRRALELEERVLVDFSRQALDHGDLVLARSQADLLPGGAERDRLLEEVETKRLSMRRRERQRLFALVVSGLLLVSLGLALWSQVGLRRRAAQAQRFGQDVKEMESLLRIAYMMPLRDTTPVRERVRNRAREIELRMRELGELAEGPGHYALGRAFLSLDEPGRARAHLQAAWSAGNEDPEVAYALALALVEVRMDRAGRVARPGDELTRIAELLRRSTGARSPAGYVRALLAFAGGSYEEALAQARAVADTMPSFYEARRLEGEVHTAIAARQAELGSAESFAAAVTRAEAALLDALRIARSDPANHEALARLRLLQARAAAEAGASSSALSAALGSSLDALVADPRSASAQVTLGDAFRLRAELDRKQARSSSESFGRAARAYEAALKVDPTNPMAAAGLTAVRSRD